MNVSTALDSLGMAKAASAIPDQIRSTMHGAKGLVLRPVAFESALVVGESPTNHAVDLLDAVFASTCSVPVVFARPGALPGFVGPRTFVVAVETGGGDSAVDGVIEHANALGATVAAVARPGRLEESAKRAEVASLDIPALPRPRAALFAIVAALGSLFERAGFIKGAEDSLARAADQAERRLVAPGHGDDPIEVARLIGRTFPFVVGASGIGAAAARWWRAEVAANSRTLSFAASVPEMFFDTIAAFGQSGDVTRQVLSLVVLRTSVEAPEAEVQFAAVDEELLEVVSKVLTVRAEGEGPLAEVVDLATFGTLVSLALARAAGVDPGPAPAIDESPRPSART